VNDKHIDIWLNLVHCHLLCSNFKQ